MLKSKAVGRDKSSIPRLLRRLAKTKFAGHTLTELERLAVALKVDEKEILKLYVESKNTVSRERLASTSFKDRVLLLPQCLRSRACPAKLGEYGYECEKCGGCEIEKIVEESLRLGCKAFILPGGTLVEKIFREFKPRACIGVACLKEIVLGAFVSERVGVTSFGVPLLKEGCVGTAVDWTAVKTALHLSIKQV